MTEIRVDATEENLIRIIEILASGREGMWDDWRFTVVHAFRELIANRERVFQAERRCTELLAELEQERKWHYEQADIAHAFKQTLLEIRAKHHAGFDCARMARMATEPKETA